MPAYFVLGGSTIIGQMRTYELSSCSYFTKKLEVHNSSQREIPNDLADNSLNGTGFRLVEFSSRQGESHKLHEFAGSRCVHLYFISGESSPSILFDFHRKFILDKIRQQQQGRKTLKMIRCMI